MTETYLRFEEVSTKTRTRFFRVISLHRGNNLGAVYWHPQWRQYCFFPGIDTVWSAGCMREIEEFIESLMNERRKER